jgi:hypothetical protein
VGDQPKDISNLIRDMVMSFITKPTAIILAVSSANVCDWRCLDCLIVVYRVILRFVCCSVFSFSFDLLLCFVLFGSE